MLVQAISFEIHNVKLNIHQEFLVEATEDNYEKVLQDRFTRQIQFVRVFDFEFAKKESIPLSFIEFDDEIDSVDEMVGAF